MKFNGHCCDDRRSKHGNTGRKLRDRVVVHNPGNLLEAGGDGAQRIVGVGGETDCRHLGKIEGVEAAENRKKTSVVNFRRDIEREKSESYYYFESFSLRMGLDPGSLRKDEIGLKNDSSVAKGSRPMNVTDSVILEAGSRGSQAHRHMPTSGAAERVRQLLLAHAIGG
jgi:hypothetical protein